MKNFFKKSESTFVAPNKVMSVVSFSFDRNEGWQVIATTLLPNAGYKAEREVVGTLGFEAQSDAVVKNLVKQAHDSNRELVSIIPAGKDGEQVRPAYWATVARSTGGYTLTVEALMPKAIAPYIEGVGAGFSVDLKTKTYGRKLKAEVGQILSSYDPQDAPAGSIVFSLCVANGSGYVSMYKALNG
mgnify:FL=1|tara:strand:+ start:1294 stop:1851 length:558 start_codon:yes stop_codon:yes gene_type:complete